MIPNINATGTREHLSAYTHAHTEGKNGILPYEGCCRGFYRPPSTPSLIFLFHYIRFSIQTDFQLDTKAIFAQSDHTWSPLISMLLLGHPVCNWHVAIGGLYSHNRHVVACKHVIVIYTEPRDPPRRRHPRRVPIFIRRRISIHVSKTDGTVASQSSGSTNHPGCPSPAHHRPTLYPRGISDFLEFIMVYRLVVQSEQRWSRVVPPPPRNEKPPQLIGTFHHLEICGSKS